MPLPRGIPQDQLDEVVAALSAMGLSAKPYGDVLEVPKEHNDRFFVQGRPTDLTLLLRKILASERDAPSIEKRDNTFGRKEERVVIAGWGGIEGFNTLRVLADLGVTFRGSEGYRSDRPDRIEPEQFKEKVVDVLAEAGLMRRELDKFSLVFPNPYALDRTLVGDLLKGSATPSALRVALQERGINPVSNGLKPEIIGRDNMITLADAGLEFAGSEDFKGQGKTVRAQEKQGQAR